MAYGVCLVYSILDGNSQLHTNTDKEAIPKMFQGQRYLSITQLLSAVVGPSCLETFCSQKGIGQQEAMFYKLV